MAKTAFAAAALVAVSQLPRTTLAVRATGNVASKTAGSLSNIECGKEIAVPADGESLQEYFDGLREEYGILDDDGSFLGEGGLAEPETCTKKDVCLLMRQLDMDFYSRAREGLLQDIDYQVPPTKLWISDNTCHGHQDKKGFKMRPLTDVATCKKEATRAKMAFRGVTSSGTMPTGCVSKGKVVYLNKRETKVEAGITYKPVKQHSRQHQTRKTTLKQLCEMDRSLSESASVYFSPYKLETSMVGRESQSTSCSFGMYAFLAKLRETMSPCAKILTYKINKQLTNVRDALDLAARFEGKGEEDAAAKLRQYVETIRQKYVLINVITNQWCPDIWKAALVDPGATCKAERVMAWTAEGKVLSEANKKTTKKNKNKKPRNRLEAAQQAAGQTWDDAGNQDLLNDIDALLASIKNEDEYAEGLLGSDGEEDDDEAVGEPRASLHRYKYALTESSCSDLADETLADMLGTVPEMPPDFFAKALVAEGDA
eukprot:TRINITY_DN111970_c0_g1_i1.p1 TRINITY_DN111970_c0_g1~~TRINITY_DN111970_c0_g1_i1.p1  ORF type:complete len:509 (+),score=98.19 TRINITY_DN111970_c0_g1_i1:74-1528(+)